LSFAKGGQLNWLDEVTTLDVAGHQIQGENLGFLQQARATDDENLGRILPDAPVSPPPCQSSRKDWPNDGPDELDTFLVAEDNLVGFCRYNRNYVVTSWLAV
jgi:hypothetical protein